ncbi:MAG: hypothetical protein FD175_572 [Beijerinckiaceae bacterium]|nr:MAG: hypothetical protein FD175_572 [Beijerinckiaceae bacterium]
MIDAIRSILLYDAMQRATRLAKGFTVSDMVRGDLAEEAVRGYRRCLRPRCWPRIWRGGSLSVQTLQRAADHRAGRAEGRRH